MIANADLGIWFVGIYKSPATLCNTAERCVRRDLIDSLIQETAPIVWHDFVERLDDVIKCVRQNCGRRIMATVKPATKIIERELPATLLPDKHISLEPDQRSFIVVINAPAIVHP